MKRQRLAFSQRYQNALQLHLAVRALRLRSSQPQRLGRQAVRLGLETLDMARIHKAALVALALPAVAVLTRNRLVKRAATFFGEAIGPIEQTHHASRKSAAALCSQEKSLARHTKQLAAANRELKRRIIQRKATEGALRMSGKHYAKLLRESHHLQKHLQRLMHRISAAQELERTKIRSGLRNEIAQTLLGMNVRLLSLKKRATARGNDLKNEIANTQRLVKKSIHTMHRFASRLSSRNEAKR